MSALNQELNEALPSNIYYDLQISNFNNETQKPQQFHYNNTNSIPYLINPEAYDLSIMKFQIDTGQTPIFIPNIQRNQPDINRTIYSVCLKASFGNVEYESDQIFITWSPQDQSTYLPLPTNQTHDGLQDDHGGYYFCYSYSWFTQLVSEAYSQALDSLRANAGAGVIPDEVKPPVIYWNSNNTSATIECQREFYNLANADGLYIYMNSALFNIYNSFPARFKTFNSAIGANYNIVAQPVLDINVSELTDDKGVTEEYITIPQEYSTTMSWSPFTSLVFTSNTIPIIPNIVNPTLVYLDNEPISVGSLADTSNENIITDMTSADGQYRSGLTYYPSGEYRKISLTGNQPLSNLDLNIYFRTKLGKLVPYRMSAGGTVNIKFGFFKK
jgi:hypothetical protein